MVSSVRETWMFIYRKLMCVLVIATLLITAKRDSSPNISQLAISKCKIGLYVRKEGNSNTGELWSYLRSQPYTYSHSQNRQTVVSRVSWEELWMSWETWLKWHNCSRITKQWDSCTTLGAHREPLGCIRRVDSLVSEFAVMLDCWCQSTRCGINHVYCFTSWYVSL